MDAFAGRNAHMTLAASLPWRTIMTSRARATLAALSLAVTLSSLPAEAEVEFKLIPGNNARNLLVYQRGQVVTLQLCSGKELTGTVTTIGEHLVHLSRLSGRDFYDAAVAYEHIEAVIIKARAK
jgi:hypothetical protein